MEKTIQVTLGSTQFHLTESAYSALKAYLESLKAHFAQEADKDEIIRDIESRIAEKLLESKTSLVTEADVTRVITEMGTASQFESGNETSSEEPSSAEKGTRKFYRDTDNAILAGVASGIAAYFSVDTKWVRLAFIVSVFFGGTGIFVYILLWLFVPEAASTTQKLEMRGAVVNLDSITRIVKERVDEAQRSGATQKIAGVLHRAVQKLFRIVGGLMGAFLSVGAFFGILGLSLASAITVVNWDTPYVSGTIRDVATPFTFWTGLTAGYVAIVIPLIFIFAFGVRLIRSKSTLPSSVGFGLLGIWFFAIIASGAIATRIAGDYYTYTATSADLQELSQPLTLDDFSSIRSTGARVTIKEGSATSVILHGNRLNSERLHATTSEETLVITVDEWKDACVLFCYRTYPWLEITVPDIENIDIARGNLSIENLKADEVHLSAVSSSVRGKLAAPDLSIIATNSSVSIAIQADELTLSGKESHFNLEGEAETADISVRRSSLNAEDLFLGDTTLRAFQSFARLHSSTLEIAEEDSSDIENEGER